MGVKALLSKPLAAYVHKKDRSWIENPVEAQQAVFKSIVRKAQATRFGRDHGFSAISSHADFVQAVPVRDYEGLSSYFNRVKQGEKDVLWPGKPLYLAKTSGTTSGTKYIPITSDSISNHINGARNALLAYVHETGNSAFLDGKLIFLSGSPELEEIGGIKTGRLSGIANHHVPGYLRTNQLPSYQTNCIEDWETKLDQIIEETIDQNMTLISGIPPWVQMYFDKLMRQTGKPIKDIFPNFQLFVYGGVNFEPYRKKLFESIGKEVDSIELFPASEGFFAYQNQQQDKGLLLLLNDGIFYEFIPVEEYFKENPTRLTIGEVEPGVNYALVISSNAGLWSYSIGDTVKFTSIKPYKVVVSGRIKHFISAFGEHVIGEEVEKAMQRTMAKFPTVELIEFTVAPHVSQDKGASFHEWLVEFSREPQNLEAFTDELDQQLQKLNSYYYDLISGNILQRLKITGLPRGTFRDYMKSQGKLGGQNKVPRLSNDRKLADGLLGVAKL
ncbi:GH3 auxin-responsive promoter [Pontibacter ummariensis]|uniref:GH3 auxin-responsive promoter n=1 Tax=Pontibacter ummariensis TaxID=1610492 RepID=A0A239E5R3_9BACT|nr:GH3 auxin-responsive promoter family protein [Pontibacter ummariensis]PRY13097.1 GH3 auxin-responsive promoter [Pontibacter ummariensis]SNS40006.1 GH3 auxin-responsive promoter [Pontibacter ummariensis]